MPFDAGEQTPPRWHRIGNPLDTGSVSSGNLQPQPRTVETQMSDTDTPQNSDDEGQSVLFADIEAFIGHCNQLGRSRELALAITNAEQALMRARKHIGG